MASITFPAEPTPVTVDLTGTDFEVIGNSGVPATDENLLVELGRLHSPSDEVRRAIRYTGTGSTTGIKIAEATAAGASSLGTLLWGPAMLDSSGNGYAARVNEGAATLYVMNAFNGVGDALDTSDATFAANGKYRMHWDQDTGAISVFTDDTLIMSVTDTTYDGTDGLKESVFFYSWAPSDQGIIMFATEVGGVEVILGFQLTVNDKLRAPVPDDIGYTVVVRENINSTAVLYETNEAVIVDGVIDVTTDTAGDLNDEIAVWVHKEGAEIEDDLNAFGFATIIDFNEGV